MRDKPDLIRMFTEGMIGRSFPRIRLLPAYSKHPDSTFPRTDRSRPRPFAAATSRFFHRTRKIFSRGTHLAELRACIFPRRGIDSAGAGHDDRTSGGAG